MASFEAERVSVSPLRPKPDGFRYGAFGPLSTPAQKRIVVDRGISRGPRDCGTFVVEWKCVATRSPVHPEQLLTPRRLMHLPGGLLINFGAATFTEGVKRIANQHRDFAASRLRANQGLRTVESRTPAIRPATFRSSA